MQFKRKHRYLLSISSGILMALSFPHTGGLFPLIFIAWVPLLLIEHQVYREKYKPGKVLLHAYITFFIYNLGATFWIYYAKGGEAGAILAYFLNGFLMALAFQLFHLTKRYIGQKEGYIGILFYWVGFEYFHYHWELSWPWINQGNIFATVPEIVQWYSYTGILGGTLWILLINLLIFKIVSNVLFNKEKFNIQTPFIYATVFMLMAPIVGSLITYYNYEETKNPVEIVVTQPNVDPYNEKFSGNLTDQLNRFVKQADTLVTPKTQFVLAPETAISRNYDEAQFEETNAYQLLKQKVREWDGPALYLGASTFRLFDVKNSRASRKRHNTSGFLESYNTSLLIEAINPPSFVHKSKLVLGVEKIPFSHIFPWLEQLSIENGGTSGTLGIEDTPKTLTANGITFAPVVCYESVYGGFIAAQCRKGASAIFIITNDGWWEDTPGHRQHHSIARLRAIETRRYVARSANTGISSVINQRGDVIQKTKYWEPAAFRETIQLNSEPTFYVVYGDVIGRSFSFVFFLLLAYLAVKYLRRFGNKSFR